MGLGVTRSGRFCAVGRGISSRGQQKTLADRKVARGFARRRSGKSSLSVDALGKYEAGQRCHDADASPKVSQVSTLRDGVSASWTRGRRTSLASDPGPGRSAGRCTISRWPKKSRTKAGRPSSGSPARRSWRSPS
ncbi:Uncharacterised protein [Amycolatopsis camponoti]|uniref:Uncharacterized protein n=1 Tax=Amycolatopsis camponoti TaxID=2606593 RepID=A0A6I8LWJ6_9PSEU|nr:Uncharacterised protein [Amycolatopsis camponoti]